MDTMEGRLTIPVMCVVLIVQNFQDLFFVFQQLFLQTGFSLPQQAIMYGSIIPYLDHDKDIGS